MHKNNGGRVTFLVNLMFSRLDKFDGPIFGRCMYDGGRLILGMLIGLHIWGAYIRRGRINEILRYIVKLN